MRAKYKKLLGVTVAEKKLGIEKPMEDFDLNFVSFWGKLRTPQYKGVFLISLKLWGNGTKFLLHNYPRIKAGKGELRDGNIVIQIFENAQRKDEIINLLNNYLFKESFEALEILLRLLEPVGITKKDFNLL